MKPALAIFRRELAGYFRSPLAFIFVALFVFLANMSAFYFGGFLERNEAGLNTFFSFHPYLYILFMPALGMRLWAEERKTGTIELLLTLPVSTTAAVIGKFLAAWVIAAIALVFTLPMWATVTYLGSPDHGLIAAGYLGSWLMAGGFLAIAACISATTDSQVIAFVLGAVISFLFCVTGLPMLQDAMASWAPLPLIDAVAGLSALNHFQSIVKGVLDGRDLVYFLSMIVVWLVAGGVAVNALKGRTG